MKTIAQQAVRCYQATCIKAAVLGQAYSNLLLFCVGTVLLTAGLACLSTAQPGSDANAEPLALSPVPGTALLPGEFTFTLPVQPAYTTPVENTDAPYNDTLVRNATGNLFMFIEGAFGALVMVASGLGAIVAASFGAYKAAIALLFVALGAFILRSLVSLFFGTDYPAYYGGGGVIPE